MREPRYRVLDYAFLMQRDRGMWAWCHQGQPICTDEHLELTLNQFGAEGWVIIGAGGSLPGGLGPSRLIFDAGRRSLLTEKRIQEPTANAAQLAPLTFREHQERLTTWCDHNFPDNRAPWRPLLGAVEGVGELAHAYLKTVQGIRGTAEEHRASMVDAICDLVHYLADFCQQIGVDLGEAVQAAWDEIKDRDWRRYAKNGRTE